MCFFEKLMSFLAAFAQSTPSSATAGQGLPPGTQLQATLDALAPYRLLFFFDLFVNF